MAALPGHVTIVGAGPGPAEYLTQAAVKAVKEADVCLHDRMVGSDVLALLKNDADIVNVGKGFGKPGRVMQMACNAIMTREAAMGKRVVRLQTGDPAIFGRMGEQLKHLTLNKIPYKIIPGVTAASAAAAAAKVPLTLKNSQQVLITSGQSPSVPSIIATLKNSGNIASYMCGKYLSSLVPELISNGAPSSTKVAIVSDAARETETTQVLTLSDIVKGKMEGTPDEQQTLCIIGEAANLPESLKAMEAYTADEEDGPKWEEPPLDGKEKK